MEGRVSKEPAQRVVRRKKQPFFDLKLLYYTLLAVALFTALYLHPPMGEGRGERAAARELDASSKETEASSLDWKELGHDLLTRELWSEALEAYDSYLEHGSYEASEAANLVFKMGDICKDRLEDYERAISYYLRVRQYDSDSPTLEKVGLRVVNCLDAIGNTRQSQHELNSLTNIDRDEEDARPLSPIVAQTASKDFTLLDVKEGIEKLPKALKKRYQGARGRMRFLREHLLLPHLLYEAGRRKGLQKDPAIRSRVRELEKNLIASKVMERRLGKMEEPSDEDLKLFYEAKKERYRQAPSRKGSLWTTSSSEAASSLRESLENGMETSLEPRIIGPVKAGQAELSGFSESEKIVKMLFELEQSELSAVFELDGELGILRMDGETPGELLPLERVKERVAADYRNFKRQEEMQELLDEEIASQQVTVDHSALFPAHDSPKGGGGK
mgnify:CR=1 FL=1